MKFEQVVRGDVLILDFVVVSGLFWATFLELFFGIFEGLVL